VQISIHDRLNVWYLVDAVTQQSHKRVNATLGDTLDEEEARMVLDMVKAQLDSLLALIVPPNDASSAVNLPGVLKVRQGVCVVGGDV
jgi:hypothetical protein